MGVDVQTYRAKIGSFRHSCGVDVVTIVCVINFSRCLKNVGCVLFIGVLLLMAGIEANPGPRDSDQAKDPGEIISENDDFPNVRTITERETTEFMVTESLSKIKVSGLPDDIDEEILEMIFEDVKKQGGGKVKSVTIDRTEKWAFIEFEEQTAVDIVMKKQPIVISGIEVHIQILGQNRDSDEKAVKTTDLSHLHTAAETDSAEVLTNKDSTIIQVSGLPDNIDEEILEMIFENENKQGGGKVKSVTIEKMKNYAVIEFEERNAVDILLEKQPITISGTEVDIKILGPEDFKEKVDPPMIKVSGLPVNIDEEILEMVFENEKKQGGGKVKAVTIDSIEHSAIIEFEDPNAVETVMKKRPIIIAGIELNLTKFETAGRTKSLEHSLIEVSGLPDNIDEDILEMVFENEKKQGGGKVKAVTIDVSKHTAFIEFEDPKAVEIVMKNGL